MAGWLHRMIAALDQEQIQLFLAEHWRKACADPLGYAFWGAIWTCAFVATFLLIRMFFTGWGDRNVTEKTLGLSILVHALIAMLSTTVMLATEKGPPAETRTRIRRVLVEGDQTQARALAGAPGTTPRWDQADQLAENEVNRLEHSVSEEETPLERQPQVQTPGIDLPVATSVAPADPPPTDPHLARVPERFSPAAQVEAQIDSEETASRRPEVETSRRPERSVPRDADEEVVLNERTREERRESVSTTTADRNSASLSSPAPEPAVTSAGDVRRSTPRGPGAAPATDLGEAGELPRDPENSQPASAGQKFARTGRDRKRAADDDLSDGGLHSDRPVREATGEPGSLSRQVASRSRVDGGATGELAPSVMRSGIRSPGAGQSQGKVPEAYRLRGSDARGEAARRFGATDQSEQAVNSSLAWLARQQKPEGYWPALEAVLGDDPEPPRFTTNNDAREEARLLAERRQSGLQSESGLTGLAILAFLGAGHTTEDEQYGETVTRGLKWLIGQQYRWRDRDKESQKIYDGYLGGQANRFARMYCHGMATIALGEAYGMTHESWLREPLIRAVQHTVKMQYPDGSWRYSDWRNQEGPTGDMSLFGWHLMALKSAQTAGIRLPDQALEKAVARAQKFLDDRQVEMKNRGDSRHGGLAAYRSGERPKPAMTAEALFCRQLLGVDPQAPVVVEAVEYLRRRPPRLSSQDLYYWYYATLALYQQGGAPWKEWNEALLAVLVSDQRTDGELAGSWNPRRPWGDYGGRVFSTAMSTLCLEVYYRYLPLYQGGETLEPSTR